MSVCPVCADKKRVQVRVMPFHLKGTTYHFDCPKCGEAEDFVKRCASSPVGRMVKLIERLKNGMIHADIYGNGSISTRALQTLLDEVDS